MDSSTAASFPLPPFFQVQFHLSHESGASHAPTVPANTLLSTLIPTSRFTLTQLLISPYMYFSLQIATCSHGSTQYLQKLSPHLLSEALTNSPSPISATLSAQETLARASHPALSYSTIALTNTPVTPWHLSYALSRHIHIMTGGGILTQPDPNRVCSGVIVEP